MTVEVRRPRIDDADRLPHLEPARGVVIEDSAFEVRGRDDHGKWHNVTSALHLGTVTDFRVVTRPFATVPEGAPEEGGREEAIELLVQKIVDGAQSNW